MTNKIMIVSAMVIGLFGCSKRDVGPSAYENWHIQTNKRIDTLEIRLGYHEQLHQKDNEMRSSLYESEKNNQEKIIRIYERTTGNEVTSIECLSKYPHICFIEDVKNGFSLWTCMFMSTEKIMCKQIEKWGEK